MAHGKPNGDIEFHYLIGSTSGITHFTETYQFGLFSIAEIGDALEKQGLQWQHFSNVMQKRGLIVGSRRQSIFTKLEHFV